MGMYCSVPRASVFISTIASIWKRLKQRAEWCPDDLAFIVGAGQQSTLGTINEIRKAARAGADAVLVITPYFYRSAISQQTLVDFYTAVADEAPVPVLLYSMPPLTGIKIEPETIARLSGHSNIIGVKDSSNDIAGFSKTVNLCPPDFAVLTGNGTVLVDALRAGATGAILAVGCAVPEFCVEIFRVFKAGEEERAAMLQSKLTPLAAAVTTRFRDWRVESRPRTWWAITVEMYASLYGRPMKLRAPKSQPCWTGLHDLHDYLAAQELE